MKFHYFGPDQTSTPEQLLDKLLHPPTSMIAVDTETVSLKDRTMIGFGIAINPQEAFYIPVWPERSEILDAAYNLVCRTDIFKLGHNYNYDISVFRQYAHTENKPLPDYINIHDTGIMANVSAQEADLHSLGNQHTQGLNLFTIPFVLDEARRLTGKKSVTMLDADQRMVAEKCCNDVRTTYALWEPLISQLNERMWDCYEVDRQLMGVLKTFEQTGLKINKEIVGKKYKQLQLEVEVLTEWAEEQGFNISSPMQVGQFLAQNRVVLPFTASGRQLDTSEEALSRYASHPLVKEILHYRKQSKLLSTYIKPYRKHDRAYTHFRLDLATGRLASGNEECQYHLCRNQQNVPPEYRDIFEPDSGMFTWADMSQLEMRMIAYLSGDETLNNAYKENKSIHEVTFRSIYPQLVYNKSLPEYTLAKTFNFAMVFDATDSTLAAQCGISTTLAKKWKQIWFDTYPGVYRWMKSQQNSGSTYEETIFGRRMRIPPDYERGKSHSNKCRINYPVQGSGADLNKRAMLELWKIFGNAIRLQVHDEVVLDGEFELEFPHDRVSRIHPDIYVPWDVKQGKVWI